MLHSPAERGAKARLRTGVTTQVDRTASFDHLVGERQELTWTTQRQITLTSPFQNAITTLTLGFPPSSVSSCTATCITTLGFFARAFAHSRSIISAFSTSVSRRRMNILRDKWPRCRRAAEKRDERAASHVWMAPAWQEKMQRATQRSLAVMCPACSRSPDGLLALMESANRGLIIRAGSMSQ